MTRSRSMERDVPDIHHRAEELGAVLPPLLVAAERVAATVSQGVHGRRRVGQGETFWQFRRYESGDAVQQIDWRQSARSDPVYVRETEWEAAQTVWMWCDGSASMDYSSDDALPAKRGRAALLTLALAVLLVRGGEHIALLDGRQTPSSGRMALMKMAAALEAPARDARPSRPPTEHLPRDSRLVLISDFLMPLDDLRRALGAFAARGVRGHLLRIVDPAEETLPFTGRVLFEGMEDEGEALIERVESVRDAYRRAWIGHGEGITALARSAGWDVTVHHTGEEPETPLLSLYVALSDMTGA